MVNMEKPPPLLRRGANRGGQTIPGLSFSSRPSRGSNPPQQPSQVLHDAYLGGWDYSLDSPTVNGDPGNPNLPADLCVRPPFVPKLVQ